MENQNKKIRANETVLCHLKIKKETIKSSEPSSLHAIKSRFAGVSMIDPLRCKKKNQINLGKKQKNRTKLKHCSIFDA